MKKHTLIAGAVLLAGAAPAAGTVIKFMDQPMGWRLGALTYQRANFLSDTGQFYAGAAGLGHEICPLTRLFSCAAGISVQFTTPVKGLTFTASGDDRSDTRLSVTGFSSAGAFSVSFGGFDGRNATSRLIDLSSYTGTTSIMITNDDPNGLGYDNFSFNSMVPEPAMWGLMTVGFGFAGLRLRSRRCPDLAA